MREQERKENKGVCLSHVPGHTGIFTTNKEEVPVATALLPVSGHVVLAGIYEAPAPSASVSARHGLSPRGTTQSFTPEGPGRS